eukprot:gene11979-13074_t
MNLESEIEESLWDFLKDRKEGEDVEALSSTESSVIPHDNTVTDETESRVVYFKKRKYEKRQDDADQWTYPKAPTNLPDCDIFVEGVKPVLNYFLLALQLSPDNATRVFDVQLKQSSADVGKTEVSCRFLSRNTKMYELNHRTFIQAFKTDLQEVLDSCSSKRKLKKTGDSLRIEDMDDHQLLFDPISGIFLKSKFARAETLVEYQVEGSMIFIVNEEMRIERIIGRPVLRAALNS